MFGGQDDNAVPQNGGGASQQEEPLNGVSDLLGGSTPASDNPTAGFMPTPSEPPQSSVPAPQEEAEDVAQAGCQLGNRVPQPAFSEGAEERKVLPHLRRGCPAAGGQLFRADRAGPLLLERLEGAQIEREASDGRLGDSGHFRL